MTALPPEAGPALLVLAGLTVGILVCWAVAVWTSPDGEARRDHRRRLRAARRELRADRRNP